MERDFELIRQIMFHLEKNDSMDGIDEFEPKAERADYHLVLLQQAELISGIAVREFTQPNPGRHTHLIGPVSLTWAGHDFLDSIRDDSIWGETKRCAAKVGGGVAFSVLKAIAIGCVNAKLGLK